MASSPHFFPPFSRLLLNFTCFSPLSLNSQCLATTVLNNLNKLTTAAATPSSSKVATLSKAATNRALLSLFMFSRLLKRMTMDAAVVYVLVWLAVSAWIACAKHFDTRQPIPQYFTILLLFSIHCCLNNNMIRSPQ